MRKLLVLAMLVAMGSGCNTNWDWQKFDEARRYHNTQPMIGTQIYPAHATSTRIGNTTYTTFYP